MSFYDSLRCGHCGTTTSFKWERGIKYICSNCRKEINLLDAIIEGRYNNVDLVKTYDKNKKKNK